MAQAQAANGKIVQIIGSVIDVEFPREGIPAVYEALKLEQGGLTLEVQQQLGDGIVRTIAMGSSEGLKRGLAVKATGAPSRSGSRMFSTLHVGIWLSARVHTVSSASGIIGRRDAPSAAGPRPGALAAAAGPRPPGPPGPPARPRPSAAGA